jgi:hypothetical protein
MTRESILELRGREPFVRVVEGDWTMDQLIEAVADI